MDRNVTFLLILLVLVLSLSARRAWIEIPRTSYDFPAPKVALRKESVDRNLHDVSLNYKEVRRSPQGERG